MGDRTPKVNIWGASETKQLPLLCTRVLKINRHHSSTKAMPRSGGFPPPLSAFCTGSRKIQEGNSSSALPALAAFP